MVRPIPVFQVGDTVLKSPHSSEDGSDLIHCQAEFDVHLFGEVLQVRGMPFIQQETHVGVCAVADLWMVARYMNRLGETRRYRPSELTELATSHFTFGSIREGLINVQMIEALRQMGLNPELVTPQNATDAREVLYAYVESEVPVIVGLPGHVAVVIGHDYTPNMLEHSPPQGSNATLAGYVNAFFVHDDREGPYIRRGVGCALKPQMLPDGPQEVLTLDDKNVDYCIAIVPPRVHLRPEDAIQIGTVWIRGIRQWVLGMDWKSIPGVDPVKEGIIWEEEDLQDLVFRPYLRSSGKFKREIMEFARRTQIDPAIAARYWCMPMPKYVWVLELSKSTEVGGKTPCERPVRGEIILDSTANRFVFDDCLLAFHLNGRMYWREKNKEEPEYLFEWNFDSKPRPPLLRPLNREPSLAPEEESTQ